MDSIIYDEKMIKKRILYEKMLAEISEMAVSINDMDIFLKNALEKMGIALDVTRVFLFHYNESKNLFKCICGWDSPLFDIKRDEEDIILCIPHTTKELMSGKILNYSNTKNMPFKKYREHLLYSHIKSTLNVPLFVYEEMYGFIGFDEHRYHRKWQDSDLYILTTAAQILSRAIENKIYERELVENRSLLESILGSVQDAIIAVDVSLRVITSNRATARICREKMAVGAHFEHCDSGCTKACLAPLKDVLNTKRDLRDSQICCFRGDGREQVSMANCSPLRNGKGDFMGAVLVIRDITRLTRLETVLRERRDYQGLIGQSEPMQKIYDLLHTLADMDTTVLITGESGTGKEKIAHALHYGGRRARYPFIRVNCSALAENLLESELFGHAKGAFTGADRESMGRFEAASGGTILLDEIGDISPLIQLKLLRVLEEKEIERVGESRPRRVDVRVLAATHRDLRKAIVEERFREDLYYRLNVMNIHIPPLRERAEDIPLLVEHFRVRFNARYGKAIVSVSADVMEMFTRHLWPGNVRELEHVIERAFVLCEGPEIRLEHIALESVPATPPLAADDRERLLFALEKSAWNVSRCARLLGVSRWTLYRRMLRFGLERPYSNV